MPVHIVAGARCQEHNRAAQISGHPQRWVGMRSINCRLRSGSARSACVLRVAMYPGAIALTLMPRPAMAQVAVLSRHLASRLAAFDLEVSVDETDAPTTPAEHIVIAGELRRLGVPVISLAPRFVGRFEKRVDYIGDLSALRDNLDVHAAIARSLGPSKLSLHSGSDKFSVYPLITVAARGRVHLKTAGTSYLEALRVIAAADPPFFREIAALARLRYPVDRATHHVSAELDRMPDPVSLPDEALPGLLDDFGARRILHVTFGSALGRHGPRIHDFLVGHEAQYASGLERHFVRHLAPFAR